MRRAPEIRVTKRLQVPPTLTLVFPPPYAPELHPAERLWLFLREHFLSHRVFANLQAAMRGCCDAGRQIRAATRRLASLTDYSHLGKVRGLVWDGLMEESPGSGCAWVIPIEENQNPRAHCARRPNLPKSCRGPFVASRQIQPSSDPATGRCRSPGSASERSPAVNRPRLSENEPRRTQTSSTPVWP